MIKISVKLVPNKSPNAPGVWKDVEVPDTHDYGKVANWEQITAFLNLPEFHVVDTMAIKDYSNDT